jgi:preprotein translocase subunit SecF
VTAASSWGPVIHDFALAMFIGMVSDLFAYVASSGLDIQTW